LKLLNLGFSSKTLILFIAYFFLLITIIIVFFNLLINRLNLIYTELEEKVKSSWEGWLNTTFSDIIFFIIGGGLALLELFSGFEFQTVFDTLELKSGTGRGLGLSSNDMSSWVCKVFVGLEIL